MVIEAHELTKRYGGRVVVNRLSFAVAPGEVFGLLGPNGAGKTTTVEMLEGLREPDSGVLSVLGCDPSRHRRTLAERIGVQLQSTALFGRLTILETVRAFAQFYRRHLPTAELLALVGLESAAHRYVELLSGGQRQALAIGLALLHDPELVFLDEPTVGLDPHKRKRIWAIIRTLREQAKTIVLTTHNMEEAEELCDRVMVLHKGTIVGMDATKTLIAKLTQEVVVEFHTATVLSAGDLLQADGIERIIAIDGERYAVATTNSARAIVSISKLLIQRHGSLRSLTVKSPSLEDVFLTLTESRDA